MKKSWFIFCILLGLSVVFLGQTKQSQKPELKKASSETLYPQDYRPTELELAKAALLRYQETGVATLEEKELIEMYYQMAEGDADHGSERDGHSLDLMGGPDAFGYRYWDNQAPDTATYEWIELCGDPLASDGPVGDDAQVSVPIGFTFQMYGTNYTMVNLSTNGTMAFGGSFSSFNNMCEPRLASWRMIYPYWDDLDARTNPSFPTGGCDGLGNAPWVRYRSFGTHFVAQWNIRRISTNEVVVAEAILYPDRRIKLQYHPSMTATGASATIGVDHFSGAGNGLQYSCNAASLAAGRAISIWNPPPSTPDLVPSLLMPCSSQPSNPSAPVSMRITNSGVGTSVATQCRYSFDNGAVTDDEPVPALTAGSSVDVVYSIPIPLASGSHSLRAWVVNTAGNGTTGNDTLTCTINVAPANDNCSNAVAVMVPSSTIGTTSGASTDAGVPTCGTTITAAGVWYKVTGTGDTIIVSTCNANTNYDTKINVYTGSCGTLICETGNDDDANCGLSSLRSRTQWCGKPDTVYTILVQGFNSQTGNFQLDVSSTPGGCGTPPVEECLASAYENEYRLGPVFMGETLVAQVPFVNTSSHAITPSVTADAPFLNVLSITPPTVSPGGTAWVDVSYTGTALGWIDCALILTASGCEEHVGRMSMYTVPVPNIPGPPELVQGPKCNTLSAMVHRNGNWEGVEYSLAASIDNFATTQWLQFDGTLGLDEVFATASEWAQYANVIAYLGAVELSMKARARRGPYVTEFGPPNQRNFDPCAIELPDPKRLVFRWEPFGNVLTIGWDPVGDDSIAFLADPQYIVYASSTPDGPWTAIDTTEQTFLSVEADSLVKQFYHVKAFSRIGPLFSAVRITEPAPGEVISGSFILGAYDPGPAGVLVDISAIFQAKVGGTWVPITPLQTPQWSAGGAVWSSMVDDTPLPPGLCSLRVVETTDHWTKTHSIEIFINRPPTAIPGLTFSPGMLNFDGTASTDIDGLIAYYIWTMKDGKHHYGATFNEFMQPDSDFSILEVLDNWGVQNGTNLSWICDGVNCNVVGQRCGCKSMDVNIADKIKGKNKKFPAGHVKNDGNAATNDDDQLLGELHENAPANPGDADGAFASFNFEMRAETFYKAGNPSQDCTHYQKFQMDEKCNGAQINTDDWYGRPTWDDSPIGGATWTDDNYSTADDNTIQQHDKGSPGEIDWIDGPSRSPRISKLKDCGDAGFTYDCIFCGVVDGPEGCCRCKVRVTWTVSKTGQVTAGPTADKTGPGLGCTTGAAGGCGC